MEAKLHPNLSKCRFMFKCVSKLFFYAHGPCTTKDQMTANEFSLSFTNQHLLYLITNTEHLYSKAIQSMAITLERINNVHRSECLSTRMLHVGNSVAYDRFDKIPENKPPLKKT